jgi:hypothetical protein
VKEGRSLIASRKPIITTEQQAAQHAASAHSQYVSASTHAALR